MCSQLFSWYTDVRRPGRNQSRQKWNLSRAVLIRPHLRREASIVFGQCHLGARFPVKGSTRFWRPPSIGAYAFEECGEFCAYGSQWSAWHQKGLGGEVCPNREMILSEDWSFFPLLHIRFRAKGPRSIEAPGRAIVPSGFNLHITPRPVLFSCAARSLPAGRHQREHTRH
jgi:hypothetical protein